MYDIEFDGELYYITYRGKRIEGLDGFIEPISPMVIIKEIEYEI